MTDALHVLLRSETVPEILCFMLVALVLALSRQPDTLMNACNAVFGNLRISCFLGSAAFWDRQLSRISSFHGSAAVKDQQLSGTSCFQGSELIPESS